MVHSPVMPDSRPAVVRVQVVFSEAWWVGTKEENPEERRLPMPPEVQGAKLHDEADCEWHGVLSHLLPLVTKLTGLEICRTEG